MVGNLPASAGDTGSSPGLGRSHMPRSNYAREPQLLSLRVWSLCSTTGEAAIVRGPRTAMKSGPHLPQLEKEEQTKPKLSKRKEIIKIRAEINEIEMKKTIAKVNETKSWFYEKINKTEKPLARHIKEKRERTQINKIRNETGEVTMDTT